MCVCAYVCGCVCEREALKTGQRPSIVLVLLFFLFIFVSVHMVSHYKLSTLIIYFNSNNLIGYLFSGLIGLWDTKKMTAMF